MTLKKILDLNEPLNGVHEVTEPIQIDKAVTLDGEDGTQLLFRGSATTLTLCGPCLFIFRGLTFSHEQVGASLFELLDAQVRFEDCSFIGASGGSEEELASAVVIKGESQVVFERCHFERNDIHTLALDSSSVEFHHCLLQEARADGIVMADDSNLRASGLEVAHSGWSSVSVRDRAAVLIWDSQLSSNRCHGLELLSSSSYRGGHNLFSENGQNGVAGHQDARIFSDTDQFLGNGGCGLDLGGTSFAAIRSGLAGHNRSHGIQLRNDSRLDLIDSGCEENLGSGLALYDATVLSSRELQTQSNQLAGVQSGDQSRVDLVAATVTGNRSSGVVAFGASHLTLDGCTVSESGAHGLQIGEECRALINGCQIEKNRRGGLLFAGQARATVDDNRSAENDQHGLALTGQAQVFAIRNLIEDNGLHGIYSASECHLTSQHNRCQNNGADQIHIESSPERPTTTISQEIESDGIEALRLPFRPKEIEKTMLLALLKHGRLSEAALGKVARTRRAGGAMENLIDRLNRAGVSLITHDGQGSEGNIYALKIDTSRIRKRPEADHKPTKGRNIC